MYNGRRADIQVGGFLTASRREETVPPTRSLVAFFIALAATQFGCNGKSSPTAPTPAPGHGLQRLEIEVPVSFAADRTFLPGQPSSPALVLAPGASVQLTARGYLADGTSRDVTREVLWTWADPFRGRASVTSGLVRGEQPGTETLFAHVGQDDDYVEAQKTVLVMPDGTFALRGNVRDASSGLAISNATVSVVGTHSTTQSGPDGSYVLWSVPPVADITVSTPGYLSRTQRVAVADHNVRLDLLLSEETPLARLAGTYTLTLSAHPDCAIQGTAFPDELRVRTYTAVVTQVGNELTVTLSGATFHHHSWRRFTGRVAPGLATFWLHEGYWYTSPYDGDLLEQPWPGTVLTIGGRATMSTSSLAGGLDGSFSFQNLDEPPFGSRGSRCSSPNHQFRLSH